MVFPAPFGPRNPNTSPRPTVIDSPARAVVVRYCLRSSIVCTAGEPCEMPFARRSRSAWANAACTRTASADLLSDIQQVLLVEQAGDGMDNAVVVLPDRARAPRSNCRPARPPATRRSPSTRSSRPAASGSARSSGGFRAGGSALRDRPAHPAGSTGSSRSRLVVAPFEVACGCAMVRIASGPMPSSVVEPP